MKNSKQAIIVFHTGKRLYHLPMEISGKSPRIFGRMVSAQVFHLRSNICILMRFLLITQLMETMQYLSLKPILKYEILIEDIEP